jgi:DNA-binding MarR family transcriptional regulator
MPQSNRMPPNTRSRSEIEHSALLLSRTLVDRTRSLYRELERSTGAPVQAHRALVSIADEPGIQSSRLAVVMGMQRSAVSHLLKSLSAHGWLERRRGGGDQRSVHLFVTEAGNEVVKATAGRVVGVLQRAVQLLDDTQLDELERSLQALIHHIEPASPGMVVVRPRRRRVPAT